jgi:hypothetical protein
MPPVGFEPTFPASKLTKTEWTYISKYKNWTLSLVYKVHISWSLILLETDKIHTPNPRFMDEQTRWTNSINKGGERKRQTKGTGQWRNHSTWRCRLWQTRHSQKITRNSQSPSIYARIRSQARSCKICCGWSGTRTGSSEYFGFPCQFSFN